jgi:hypothetical protein
MASGQVISVLVLLLFLVGPLAEIPCSGGDEPDGAPFDPIVADDAESSPGQEIERVSHAVYEVETDERLTEIERQLRDLSTRVQVYEPRGDSNSDDGVAIGGAVRFQYSAEDYVVGNRQRHGDIDLDIFRIDFDGELGGVLLSAQYRWYQYMNVIHHGWVGYQCNDSWQIQAGITRVPFGNLDYNSNSFFFSTNYYVGLEDDYDAGIKLVGTDERQDLRLAFLKTDEMGGIDGYVDNRADRYSYDVVGIRLPGEGIYSPPVNAVAENNTVCLRYTYKFSCTEFGGSWLYGGLRAPDFSAGSRWAYAIHSKTTIDRWLLRLQFTDYRFDPLDDTGLMIVGAYSFFDTIPAKANIYTGNVAYELPVKFGPVTTLKFYNDFNVMSNKSGGLHENSYMNITGVAVSAGGLYTYVELISAKNHPFIGGSLGSDAGDWNTRFNVNVGFYF